MGNNKTENGSVIEEKTVQSPATSLRRMNAEAALGNKTAKIELLKLVLNDDHSKNEPIIQLIKESDIDWLTSFNVDAEKDICSEKNDKEVVEESLLLDSLCIGKKVNLHTLLLDDAGKIRLYDLIIDALNYQDKGEEIYKTNLSAFFKDSKELSDQNV